MKNFLSGFKGQPLNKKQLATGMHFCYINAKSLADEVRLLKENGHFSRALSLTILALEELGKIPLICNMILYRENDAEAWRKSWKELQSHKLKLGVWTVYGKRLLRVLGKSYKTELPAGIEPLADKFKQLGFYVSFFKGQFLLPEDFSKDNQEWLEFFLSILDERLASFERFHSSLEGSEKFIDDAREFLITVKRAKTRDQLKEIITDWVSQRVRVN